MPRAGLSSADVVAAASRRGRTPGADHGAARPAARHPGSLPLQARHRPADLRHRIATQAMGEMSEAVRDALQGKAGRDAIAALLSAVQAYVIAHPGRYAATVGARFTGPDDPLLAASTRVLDSISAALRGYGVSDAEMVHAFRTMRCTIHGFAMLQEPDGFQWDGEPGDTFDWMIRFIDRGLRA